MASKESVLEEGASIYQKREKKSEKQKWSEMNRKEKRDYFKEYYRNKMIVLIIAAVGLIWLLYSILGPSVEQMLYVAVLNDYWEDAAVEQLETDMKEYLQGDPKWEDVVIDDSFYFKDDSSSDAYSYIQKLAAFIFAGDVELLVADEEQFAVYATQDYFVNLEEELPADLYAEVKDHLVYYASETMQEEVPVGIRLGESKVFQSMKGYQEDPIVGVLVNAEHKENAIKALRYFFIDGAK